jgi:iron complex transport system substrate-binding protein
MKTRRLFLVALYLLGAGAVSVLMQGAALAGFPVSFVDASGRTVILKERPSRVVSLSPSVSEVLTALGAGEVLRGVTHHDASLPGAGGAAVVGGFLSPCPDAIRNCNPDVIFCSPLQYGHLAPLEEAGMTAVCMEARSLSEGYDDIVLLGRIFERSEEAKRLVRGIQDQIALISRKVSLIPQGERKRVMRLMGGDGIMTPGHDSFQNEMIRAAGGIPPEPGGAGPVVPVDLEEWLDFDPQVLYGCGGDREAAAQWLNRPGWRDVEAVREGRIWDFPCELTCRAAAGTGRFVAWLASRLYPESFACKDNLVLEERVFEAFDVDVPLEYVRKARILRSNIYDFVNKTLVIDFAEPQRVLSTLEGERRGITSVGNHYSPPPTWAPSHAQGFESFRGRVCGVIGREAGTSSFLFTGADMDNLSVKAESYRDMTVLALVTAGVESNAVRMSRDPGRYYEPGTINILILTNMRLTPRAMSRAVISATEAKTAALQDLDIRSGEDPLRHQATGTGTDNILVVEGRGTRIDNAGGHTRMGELMAGAVYKGVQEAVFLQNGLRADRPIFSRLAERGVFTHDLSAACGCAAEEREEVFKGLEQVLLDPVYAEFVASALALSDDVERGLVRDMTMFRTQCRLVAESLAGRPVEPFREPLGHGLPEPLAMALNALLNGILQGGG